MRYVFLIVLAVATWVLVFMVDRARHASDTFNEPRAGWFRHPDEHKVTPQMIQATGKLVAQDASGFDCLGSDGSTYKLNDLVKDQPIVLLFIKEDCPCSAEAQPYFNKLAKAYGSQTRFLGVIDGGEAVAREWARRRKASFPLLCDPELKVVRQYQASNSVYVALIGKGGKLEGYWPGFSGDMLEELGGKLASLTGLPKQPIDTTDAPDEMVSGCPYPN